MSKTRSISNRIKFGDFFFFSLKVPHLQKMKNKTLM